MRVVPTKAIIAILLVGLLLGVGSVVATGPGQDNGATATSVPTDAVWNTTANASNTTVHENPEGTNENGNLTAVSGWLVDRLAGRLGDSTLQLSQSQYQQARAVIGDDYDSRLTQFIDVAGDTETKRDDKATQAARKAGPAQRNFTTTLEEYRDTLREYREARENGNLDRARQLARELRTLAAELQQLNTTLQSSFVTLGNVSDVPLREARQRLSTTTTNVTQQQAEILKDLAEPTRLEVAPEHHEISFLNPLQLTGHLTTENGTAISNQTITVRVAGHTFERTTNVSGGFELSYRPTMLSLETQNVSVQYLPEDTSEYLRSTDEVSVTVTPVTPELSMETANQTAGFNDAVTIAGNVSKNGIGAAQVPLTVRIGTQRLGAVASTRSGAFSLSEPLPATIPPGEHQITVRLGTEGRALAPVNATDTLQVHSTPTNLSIQTEVIERGTIRVTGRLTTDAGTPPGGRQVAIAVGKSIATVDTAPNGQFRLRTTLSPTAVPQKGSEIGVRATFSGDGTNLEASQTKTMLVVSETLLGSSTDERLLDIVEMILGGSSDERLPILSTLALAGGVILLSGVAILYYRRRGETEQSPASMVDDADLSRATPEGENTTNEPTGTEPTDATLLDQANAARERGDNRHAVEFAYQAVRQRLGQTETAASTAARTHWEFLEQSRSALEDATIDRLETLTEAYEQAVFAAAPVSAETVQQVIDDAQTVTDTGE